MKEMEAVVESEFAEVFVPLVMGLATYQDICVVQKAKKDWKPCDLKPFEVTTDCLQVFFKEIAIFYHLKASPLIVKSIGITTITVRCTLFGKFQH